MQDHVLVAVPSEVERRLAAALSGHELTFARTCAELRSALAAQQFDLIVVGTHFDESKAMGVIEEIRRAAPRTPLACVQGRPFQLVGQRSVEAFRLACEALGVSLVIHLSDYADGEAGNRAIRALFTKLSSPPQAA